MSALSKVLREADGARMLIWCPACDMAHAFALPRWTWDGNAEQPTFTPSLIVRYMIGARQRLVICHSTVTYGRITFHADSTHALAGQTVDLPPFAWGA